MSKLFPSATIRTSAPYRFDIVGSFLRPETLKQARHQCSCGDISCADLTQVEDAEIAKLVEQDRKSTRLNSSHLKLSRMPSSA